MILPPSVSSLFIIPLESTHTKCSSLIADLNINGIAVQKNEYTVTNIRDVHTPNLVGPIRTSISYVYIVETEDYFYSFVTSGGGYEGKVFEENVLVNIEIDSFSSSK